MPNAGFGDRLKARLRALGYWKNDRPDTPRFALERGYRPQYVYAWLRDRIPDYENLIRLARDLNVTPDWLRFGAETDEQVAAAVGVRAPETRMTRAPGYEPVARVAAEPETPRTARVIEHPMLRLGELTAKLAHAESELQETIRAWRESEERFRRVFEEGPLGMGMADPEYRLIKVNRRFCEMLGYHEDELTRLTYFDVTHPDDHALTRQLIAPLYRGQLPYLQFEKRLLKKTGDAVFAKITVFVIDDKHTSPPYSMAMVEDITAQKLMEEELTRLTQQQELILQSVADGIYGTDAQGLARFVNPAAVRLMGWEPEDLLGRDIHDFVHKFKEDGTPYPLEECPSYKLRGTTAIFRNQADVWWRKDGTAIQIEYTRAPIIRDGKVVGSVVTFRKGSELPPMGRSAQGRRQKGRPSKAN